MATKPADLIYGVDDMPPIGRLIPLGFQFVIYISVTLVYIVLISEYGNVPPEVTANSISMAMIAIGIATILQSLWKGPVGSGYFASPVYSAVYLAPCVRAVKAGGLPAVAAMTIFAGAVEIAMSIFIKRLKPVFPPAVAGFIVLVIGIELGLVALDNMLYIRGYGRPEYMQHLIVGMITLWIIMGFSIWFKGILRLLCSLIGISAAFVVALFLGIVPESSIELFKNSAVFALPDTSFISYDFEFSLVPAFFLAAIAASLRTIGVVTTAEKINDADWKKPDYGPIRKGMLADGLGCMLGGIMGAPGMNATPGIVGLSQAAGSTSRYMAFPTGIILIVLAFFPKISALFLMLPLPVVGASLVVSGAFMIAGGIEIMTSRNLDSRMTYVIGVSLLLGIGRKVYHGFFDRFPEWLRLMTDTTLSIALISSIILVLIFRLGIRKTEVFVGGDMAPTLDSLVRFLKANEKKWRLDDEVIQHARTTVEEIVNHLNEAGLASGPIRLEASYDEVFLEITIDYKGTLLALPGVGVHKRHLLEEDAFVHGIKGFLTGVYPDKIETSSRKDDVKIRLFFSV
ncbi:MAG: purine/pyrimidine permease [Candidatus Dadabacteria bacterium]|nr:purine/pyrimidine permease [Candidatus Dadabacteria bacterium]